MNDSQNTVLSRDGQQDYLKYVAALQTNIEPHLKQLVEVWADIEPVAGKLTGEYIHALMTERGAIMLSAAIYNKSTKESPFNRSNFTSYYEDIASRIKEIASDIKKAVSIHVSHLTNRVPSFFKGI